MLHGRIVSKMSLTWYIWIQPTFSPHKKKRPFFFFAYHIAPFWMRCLTNKRKKGKRAWCSQRSYLQWHYILRSNRHNMQISTVWQVRFQKDPGKDLKVDLLKGGFTHSCFIAFMHHSCQEDLTQFGTTSHHLKNNKINGVNFQTKVLVFLKGKKKQLSTNWLLDLL